MLSSKQLQDICLAFDGSHETCRYVKQDPKDFNKFFCVKLNVLQRQKIDDKIKQFCDDCDRRGIDPTTKNVPLGNNCKGYPVLRHVEQGYDVKP